MQSIFLNFFWLLSGKLDTPDLNLLPLSCKGSFVLEMSHRKKTE